MSSITDKPISLKSEDLLKVEKYSLALSNFITRSDTPITVGLQGEWGTGKTSLMSLLLEDFNKKDFNIVESLRRVLIKCSDNLKETKVGKNVGIKELDKSSMNLIADFLRPNYEHYVSPRDRVNNIEKEIIQHCL